MKKVFLFLSVLAVNTIVIAQDVHFSQAEFSPGQLNPALTGVNAPMQVNLNYRTQWASVGAPFNTMGASIEGRFNEKKRRKKGIIAGGLNFYNDNVGNMPLKTNKFNLNLAYHLILDRSSTIGLGMYTGYGQRTFDPTGGKWGNQYDGIDYNANLPSNEVFNSSQFGFLDAGAGLVYNYKTQAGRQGGKTITGGLSFFHVNQPNFSFINNEDEQLPVRWSMFVNSSFELKNSNGAIQPAAYFHKQRSNMMFLYGLYYQFHIGDTYKRTNFAIGAFNRWADAFILKSYFEIKDITFGFAYDVNISSLSEVSRGRGATEFFLQYKMGPRRQSRSQI